MIIDKDQRSTIGTLGAPVFFCGSRSLWQRGLNEYANDLLRDYFPKGTDLRVHSAEHLLAVENELDNRLRLVLAGRSPAALFDALIASSRSWALRRGLETTESLLASL